MPFRVRTSLLTCVIYADALFRLCNVCAGVDNIMQLRQLKYRQFVTSTKIACVIIVIIIPILSHRRHSLLVNIFLGESRSFQGPNRSILMSKATTLEICEVAKKNMCCENITHSGGEGRRCTATISYRVVSVVDLCPLHTDQGVGSTTRELNGS